METLLEEGHVEVDQPAGRPLEEAEVGRELDAMDGPQSPMHGERRVDCCRGKGFDPVWNHDSLHHLGGPLLIFALLRSVRC
jgi:hypothetical protein